MKGPLRFGAAVDGELWAIVMESGAQSSEARARFRQTIDDTGSDSSGIVLSTCQRTEIYGFGRLPQGLAGLRPIVRNQVARHLIRVAAGLESGVVGEDEILHQVRQALASARPESLNPPVRRLFEVAIAAGRRARAGRPTITRSLAESAIDWLAEKGDLRQILIVGAGMMAASLARKAARKGARITVASRTYEHAERLARKLNASAASLESGAELAHSSSAIAVALAGAWPQLARAPLCPVVDVSTPCALNPDVREALGERLVDIDRLLAITPGTTSVEAQAYSRGAEPIVVAAVDEYMAWLEARRMRARPAPAVVA